MELFWARAVAPLCSDQSESLEVFTHCGVFEYCGYLYASFGLQKHWNGRIDPCDHIVHWHSSSVCRPVAFLQYYNWFYAPLCYPCVSREPSCASVSITNTDHNYPWNLAMYYTRQDMFRSTLSNTCVYQLKIFYGQITLESLDSSTKNTTRVRCMLSSWIWIN